MSAFMSMARARASFIFHPPDREATGAACMSAVKPTEPAGCEEGAGQTKKRERRVDIN